MKTFIFSGETLKEAERFVSSSGEKPYRARQVYEWIFKKNIFGFDSMTSLPKSFIALLKEKSAALTLSRVERRISSKDGTRKYLFKLKDGNFVESVLLPSRDRVTVCLSTQVGCPLGCIFCATGKSGFRRNLEADEIVAQYLLMSRDYVRDTGKRVTNIVVMGMGEPFLNFAPLNRALEIFSSDRGAGISPRRITVSTSGIITGIDRFAELAKHYKLSISLHSPYDDKRKKLIPLNKKYSLKKVLESADNYVEKTDRLVTFQYLMIKGINDTEDDAFELARLLKDRKCKVNLIVYNSIKGLPFAKPGEKSIGRFTRILSSRGVLVTRRRSMGEDIESGCGQLRAARL